MKSAFGIEHISKGQLRLFGGDEEEPPEKPPNKLPKHGYVKNLGHVQILGQHSKDHFMVLAKNDTRYLLHRSRIIFRK